METTHFDNSSNYHGHSEAAGRRIPHACAQLITKARTTLPLAPLLLLSCGGGTSGASGGNRIGPAGGVVEGPNGARIEIPPGALDEEVEIGIRLANAADLQGVSWSALDSTIEGNFVSAEVMSFSFFQPGASAPEEDDGVEEAGDAYEVTPHGQEFQEPVEVTFPYELEPPKSSDSLQLFRGHPPCRGPQSLEDDFDNRLDEALWSCDGCTVSDGIVTIPSRENCEAKGNCRRLESTTVCCAEGFTIDLTVAQRHGFLPHLLLTIRPFGMYLEARSRNEMGIGLYDCLGGGNEDHVRIPDLLDWNQFRLVVKHDGTVDRNAEYTLYMNGQEIITDDFCLISAGSRGVSVTMFGSPAPDSSWDVQVDSVSITCAE